MKPIPTGLSGKRIDWVTLSLYLALVSIGVMTLYAVGYGSKGYEVDFSTFMLKTTVGKQIIFIGLSFVLLSFILLTDWFFWRNFAFLIYALSLVFLVAVLIFGKEINGAKAWFSFGGFSLQPAELTKFGTCLALSSFLSFNNANLRETKAQLLAGGLLLAPIFLIMLQPDAGSALVFLSFYIMLYRGGFPPGPFVIIAIFAALFITAFKFEDAYVILGILLAAVALMLYQWNARTNRQLLVFILWAALSWAGISLGYALQTIIANCAVTLGFILLHWRKGNYRLAPLMLVSVLVCSGFVYGTTYIFNNMLPRHQQERILVWLRPDDVDVRSTAYNLTQSKLAIGSGGFEGKGYLQGTMTRLNYVPEQSTDFIFCAVAEEHGFIGTLGIIGLFFLLLFRITIIAERQRSYFSRHYAYGVAGIIFVHFLVNLGMTMGVLPIIGIPLPFLSGGGSSLLGFTLLIGVLLKLDSHRESM